jgi:uncharacterized protein (TIGR03437 family)
MALCRKYGFHRVNCVINVSYCALPGDSPAPQPVAQPVSATVGGVSAQVQYAGGVPGLVAGVLKVNVKVPQGVAAGSVVPIIIQVGAQSSQTGVTLAIN